MVRRDLANKETKGDYKSVPKKPEHIDPNARHPAIGDAPHGTAAKASRRTKAVLSPRKSTASENVNDYHERAAHLYGQHDSRRIVANPPRDIPVASLWEVIGLPNRPMLARYSR
jgi:hypothetical protein